MTKHREDIVIENMQRVVAYCVVALAHGQAMDASVSMDVVHLAYLSTGEQCSLGLSDSSAQPLGPGFCSFAQSRGLHRPPSYPYVEEPARIMINDAACPPQSVLLA